MSSNIARIAAVAVAFGVAATGCGSEGVSSDIVDETSSSVTESTEQSETADPGETTAEAGETTTRPSDTTDPGSAPTPEIASDINKQARPSTFTATAKGSDVTAYAKPSTDSGVITTFASPNTYGDQKGQAATFQAINYDQRPDGWVEVLLPIRPNGSTGWMQQSEVSLAENSFRIEVDRAAYELRVLERGKVIQTAQVAIGTGDTPTPVGSFYINELLQPLDPDSPYGSFAYGLSGFSETLDEFNGGNGVVGIHGTNDPSSIGSDVSHGCIRLENDEIETMVNSVPLGTPVYIT